MRFVLPSAASSLFSFCLLTSLGSCAPTLPDTITPFGLTDGLLPSTGGSGSGTSVGGSSTDGGIDLNDGAAAIADRLQTEFPSCESFSLANDWRDEILALANEERIAAGLSPLRRNAILEAQAEQYACEMLHYDFFAHENPVTGTTLRDRNHEFGYAFSFIGENLAAGQRTPREAMSDWMNSDGHRENIMNPRFEDLGVGIRVGGNYDIYWVQEFGDPAAPAPAVLGNTSRPRPRP